MTKQATKSEKPAYMQAALAKQKIDKMRESNAVKLRETHAALETKEKEFIEALSPEVREIFDALDGAE